LVLGIWDLWEIFYGIWYLGASLFGICGEFLPRIARIVYREGEALLRGGIVGSLVCYFGLMNLVGNVYKGVVLVAFVDYVHDCVDAG